MSNETLEEITRPLARASALCGAAALFLTLMLNVASYSGSRSRMLDMARNGDEGIIQARKESHQILGGRDEFRREYPLAFVNYCLSGGVGEQYAAHSFSEMSDVEIAEALRPPRRLLVRYK